QGKANHVLSQKSAQEMLKPQIAAEGGDGSVGIAFFLDDRIPGEFGHNGADEGFQAFLTMNSETGPGMAMMGKSDAFFHIAPYAIDTIRSARGWKAITGLHDASEAISLLYAVKGPQAALDAYPKLKQGSIPGFGKPNEGTLNQLGYTMLRENKTEL